MGKREKPIDAALNTPPAMIRVEQAIARLGISRTTLWRRSQEGVFKIVKRGGAAYVPTAQIDAFLNPDA